MLCLEQKDEKTTFLLYSWLESNDSFLLLLPVTAAAAMPAAVAQPCYLLPQLAEVSLVVVWLEVSPLITWEEQAGLLVKAEVDEDEVGVTVNMVKVLLHPVCSQIRRETYR